MKLSRWLILLLALLSVGLLTGANLTILDTADQVTVEREMLAGDPEAADGVELALPLTCNDQLFWVTTFPADRPEETSTDFSYTLTQDLRTKPWVGQPLSVEIADAFYWGETQDSPHTLLDSWFLQAQEATPAGTEATVSFRVRDYFDTWPLRITSDLPDVIYNLQMGNSSLTQLFQDYFAFPVPDDAAITVTVHSSGGTSYSSCTPWIDSYSVLCGDTILFALTNTATLAVRDEAGNYQQTTLDGSHIPGGWGIYRYTPGSEDTVGTLETLWSLPDGAEILEFWGTEDEADFFLLTQEEGQLRLRVFDGDGNLRQSLDLLPFSEEESYMQTYKGDGFFVPIVYGSRTTGHCYRFPVVCRQPEGWALAFVGDDRQAEELGYGGFSWADNSYSSLAMAFDGARLAIRDSSYSVADGDPFWLAIYSKDGLDYLASYQSSLLLASGSNRNRLFWTGTPLVRWLETGS